MQDDSMTNDTAAQASRHLLEECDQALAELEHLAGLGAHNDAQRHRYGALHKEFGSSVKLAEVHALLYIGDQLAAIRLDHEITVERARMIREQRAPVKRRRTARTTPGLDPTVELLEKYNGTAREVKEWAVRQGLLDEVRRGRVPKHLIELWAEAQA